MSGRFIAMEGVEGVGKSTQLSLLEPWLRERGVAVVCTREPGGTRLGERIRALLLTPDQQSMVAETELLLMFAARAQHLEEIVYPAMTAGQWVISDRFTDASYAYQGAGRELGSDRVEALERWLQGDFRPDLVIVLDLSVEEGLRRARHRGAADRFEIESAPFFERVRQAYLERSSRDPQRYRVVDASGDSARVQARIRSVLSEYAGGELV